MKSFPRLSTLIRTRLERHVSKIEKAPFIDRHSNIVLPELIVELLRLDREVN